MSAQAKEQAKAYLTAQGDVEGQIAAALSTAMRESAPNCIERVAELLKQGPAAALPSGPLTVTGAPCPEGIVADLTEHETLQAMPLSVVVFGATGDLAKKKLFPALYQLCLLGHLPRGLHIVGYGRQAVDLEAFVAKQCANIKEDPRLPKASFTERISFHAGGYDSADSFKSLDAELRSFEAGQPSNRLFFLSVPPTIFGSVTELISEHARSESGFTRLMIEKPFGRDSQTFDDLNALTARHFSEQQLFRLDHYLGKEVILNIASLRWANQIFEPSWNGTHIESVQLTFKEDLGTGGRGGYFDGFGIIRDIIQNHLLQAFMWIAMEPPTSMTGEAITKAKVALLSKVATLSLDEKQVFLGQFGRHGDEGGYLEDPTVPAGSRCATFASLVLQVDTPRWRGVPFLFTAGKGMDERVCELRVRFRKHAFNKIMGIDSQNELVMRVQPDESIYMITSAKEPGITAEQIRKPVVMDMSYATQFKGAYVGDAYERMFLNAARGDQALFVSAAELVEAWRIFTPLLHQIDEQQPQPVTHAFGALPAGYIEWARMRGSEVRPTWQEYIINNGDHCDEITKVFNELDQDGSGKLNYEEVTKLASRFFDGRQPTEARIRSIFRQFDQDGDGEISLDEILTGVQAMHRAFAMSAEQLDHV